MAIVRARAPYVLTHPDGYPVAVSPAKPEEGFDDSDPLVRAHRWAFQSDAEREAGVERATADPGSKRSVRR